ncbi:hypothetical protein [Pseudomonas fluorescens]|uniref:hypothetical protein n=1 Tax=Pseudomonas fluorescens TaxID=294 RepID=UPI001240DABC|nr:hypothetical protein [Pseudomonas fluorescens]
MLKLNTVRRPLTMLIQGLPAWHRVSKPVQCVPVTGIISAHRVYKIRSAVLKVVSVAPVNFFTCLDWAVFYSHSADGRAMGAGKEAF